MKTIYAVWGSGAARNSALTNADGGDHIAARVADEHGFDATIGERWAVIISDIDESDLDSDDAVRGYRELTASEIAEIAGVQS